MLKKREHCRSECQRSRAPLAEPRGTEPVKLNLPVIEQMRMLRDPGSWEPNAQRDTQAGFLFPSKEKEEKVFRL